MLDLGILGHIRSSLALLVPKESVNALIQTPLHHRHILASASRMQNGGACICILMTNVEDERRARMVKESNEAWQIARFCKLMHKSGCMRKVLGSMGYWGLSQR